VILGVVRPHNANQLAVAPTISTLQPVGLASTVANQPISSPVFSTELPNRSLHSLVLNSGDNQLFTMLDYARQFTTDKDLFKDAEIIIIKLPGLTRFSNTPELASSYPEIIGTNTGLYK
jgi:hypothetical protein